jgi:regulator of sirC expression with transglutaminase-like and TPR domain
MILPVLMFLTLVLAVAPVRAYSQSPPAEAVREILNRPEGRLNFLDAATTFDRLIDPQSDSVAARATVARLVDAARQMAGPKPNDTYKLAAIRQAIYVAGAWNYHRPFIYDLEDPLGTNVRSKMLSSYVRSRKGNCVSMPTLFLIVADGMGLNVRLAAAPLHLFVRYTDPAGAERNLEATSGGHEARLEWYRANLPMTDRAVESGAYMRTLTKRETIAAMATSVMDFLLTERRYQEAADVADAIVAVNSRDVYAMVKKGTAISGLMETEYFVLYPNPASIPPKLRARYAALAAANERAFRDAEALGWEEPEK